MDCKIIEEIKNSKVKSWKNIDKNQTDIKTSCEIDGNFFSENQIISTKDLLENLNALYEDDADEDGTIRACYECEEIVMCLKPHEPDHIDWNPDYEVHKKYPVIVDKCIIFRMVDGLRDGEFSGIIRDYNPVQHFGKVTRSETDPPDFLEYLGLDEVVMTEPKIRDQEVETSDLMQWDRIVSGGYGSTLPENFMANIRKCVVPKAGYVLNEKLSIWIPLEKSGWEGDKNKKMVNMDGIRYIIDDDDEDEDEIKIKNAKKKWIDELSRGRVEDDEDPGRGKLV